MPIQCPKCKALNRDMATYCDKCGAPLGVPSKEPTRPSPPTPEIVIPPTPVPKTGPPVGPEPFRRRRPSKRAWGGYLVFLFLVFMGLVSYGYIAYPDYEQSIEPIIVITGMVAVVTLPIFYLVFRRRGGGGQAVFRGLVTNYQARQSQVKDKRGAQRYLDVWSFRLQHTDPGFQQLLRDAQGNPLQPLPVEIRAQTISGALKDGDKVEVHGQIMGGILYAGTVYNHSVGGAALVMR